MALFVGIAAFISNLIAWLVTGRLLSLSRRTRALPERLLAMGFAGLYCVGYPLAGMSRMPALRGTNEGALFFALGAIGMALGIGALSRFPQVVFRPGKRWARLLSMAIAITGAVGSAGCALSVAQSESYPEMIRAIQPWGILLIAAVCVCFVWNGLESTRYYGIMKRRLALGLADLETTHRFLLWAIASWATSLPVGAMAVIRAWGIPILSPVPMTIISCSTLVTSACWSLAFFMPDRYRASVLGVGSASGTKSD